MSSDMENEPHRLLEQVDGPYSFLKFRRRASRRPDSVRKLDSSPTPYGAAAGWENTTIEDFIESAAAWARDSQFGQTQGLGTANPWRIFATFLYCGKIYE